MTLEPADTLLVYPFDYGGSERCAIIGVIDRRPMLYAIFCLEDIVPAVLIILITHIILAVRWMLIKILSVVINGHRSHKGIVPDGCYLTVDIIYKSI